MTEKLVNNRKHGRQSHQRNFHPDASPSPGPPMAGDSRGVIVPYLPFPLQQSRAFFRFGIWYPWFVIVAVL